MTPFEHGWKVDEPASTEREMRHFLYGLVRITRPRLVVETGCFLGRATQALQKGIYANRYGRLISCDTNPDCVQHVIKKVPGIQVRLCRGEHLIELREADLVFLDSGYADRRREFELCKPGALVVIHDTRISFDSDVPPHETWVHELGGLLFQTYRGFGMLRR